MTDHVSDQVTDHVTAPGTARPRGHRRTRVALTVVVLALVAACGLVLGSGLRGDREPALALAGRQAPPLAGRTLDGGHANLASLRGSVVLVNVWASWCGPCRDELPLLASVSRDKAGSGLTVLGIDTRDGPVAARALLVETGATGLTSIEDPKGRLAISWGIHGVPETFVVDREGVVRERRTGVLTADWISGHVDPLLRP